MALIALRIKRVRMISGSYYWQPTPAVKALGFVAEALGKDAVKAAARAQSLNRQVDEARREPSGRPPALPGSVAELIGLYQGEPRWTEPPPVGLADRTKRDYQQAFDLILAKAPHVVVADISRRDLKATYRELRGAFGLTVANRHMRAWQVLMAFAHDEGLRPDNPALRLRLTRPKIRDVRWMPEHVDLFVKTAYRRGRPSIGLAIWIAYEIAQRPADVRLIRWSRWDGAAFLVRQAKTGKLVRVAVAGALADELNALRPKDGADGCIILTEATGAPYGESYLAHEIAKIRAAADLPAELQMRDLRRTALTEIGEGGGTEDELRAVGGHAERGSLGIYVVPTEAMARSAQTKRQARKARVRPAAKV